MSLNYLISLLLIVFSCICVFKLINYYTTNKIKCTFIFCSYTVLFSFYCLSYALEIVSQTLYIMKLFHMINIIALSFIPGLLFLIFMDSAGKLRYVKTYHCILIFIIPAVSAVLRITSGYHDFYMYDFSLKTQGVLTYLDFNKGIWFYVFSAYIMSLLILSVSLIFKWFPKNARNKFPLLVLIVVVALSLICVFIKAIDANIFLTFLFPFVVPVFSLMLSANFINYRLFNTIPFAYKKAFDWSDNCILIVNNDLSLIDYNASAEAAIPLLSEKMISKNISEFIDYDGRIMTSILTGEECKLRIIKNYAVRHYRVSSSVLLDKSGRKLGYMVSLIDITTLVEAVTELTELASVDTLTRTHTRRYFIQRASIEFSRAKRHCHPLSFIILDLDYFKRINDEFGHLAGDAMLKDIAKICKTKVRSMDLLGRFGGEEFIILLPETDVEGAVFVAERIRKTIEETEFTFESHTMNMTVSLGVTGADKITDEDFDVFLKYADRALYRAKANGRNLVEHNPCCSEKAAADGSVTDKAVTDGSVN